MDILMAILQGVFVLGFTYIAVKGLWISSIMLEERKARYRAGTHDYYDNPIEKDD